MKVKPKWSYKKILLAIIIVIIILVILNVFELVKPLNSATSFVLSKPMALLNKWGGEISRWQASNSESDENIREENKELKNKLEDLRLENSKLLQKIDALEILKEQLEFVEENNFVYVPAKVIAQPVSETENSIIINKGSSDGIKEGQAVIVKDGQMIGKIASVSYDTSKILLLIDNTSQVACQIQNDNKTPCLAKGNHGISLKLDLIPQVDEVYSDQYIITSGLEEKVPKGLYLGQIENIEATEGELFKQASVKTDVNYNFFEIVSVIIDQDNE